MNKKVKGLTFSGPKTAEEISKEAYCEKYLIKRDPSILLDRIKRLEARVAKLEKK